MEYDSVGFPLIKNQTDTVEEIYGERGQQVKIGKVKVHQSGRVTISLPNGEFEIERGIDANFKQRLLVFDDDTMTVRDMGSIGSNLVSVKID